MLNWLLGGRSPMVTDEKEHKAQSLIVKARQYYRGKHEVSLTERQKKYLKQHSDADITFVVNHCPTVVDAVVERMKVTGFSITDPSRAFAPEPTINKADDIAAISAEQRLGTLLWLWWQQNRMDAVQIEAHRKMVRDGECFLLIDWDQDLNRPQYMLHPRFVDESLGGSGFGMWIDYPNADPLQSPLRAIKQWVTYADNGTKTHRRTIYYPDHIERRVLDGGEWVERAEDGLNAQDSWPIGKIPIAHFRNREDSDSELRDVIPLQDALNKTWLDVLAAADTTAFRMLGFLGWIPTTDGREPAEDGSNLLVVLPGQNIATDKPKDEVDLKVIEPADLKPLLDAEERIVYRMATVTDTPLHRFQSTRQVARAETIKQQDEPLVGKVQQREVLAGNAWEDAMMLSIKMAVEFGKTALPDDIGDPDNLILSTQWSPAELIDDKTRMEVAKGKKELQVPIEQIWREEFGYSEDQIAEFKESEQYKAIQAMRSAAVLLGQPSQEGQQDQGQSASEGEEGEE